MTDTAPTAPRFAPMSYDARGHPVFHWTLTPTALCDPVILLIPPEAILPVVFIPGIMGSNLKSVPEVDQESEPVCQVRVQVSAAGFDHEGAFKVMQTRHFTLYSLIKIAAQAKRPSCAA
ncbi:hypothetical protein D3C77_618000 [compost metagenome]